MSAGDLEKFLQSNAIVKLVGHNELCTWYMYLLYFSRYCLWWDFQ